MDAEGELLLPVHTVGAFVDGRCLGGAFVHGGKVFCGRGREMRPPVHTEGAICGCSVPRSSICPQVGGVLWTRKGKCGRLSTLMVPFVNGRCLGGAFVLRREVFCGWMA